MKVYQRKISELKPAEYNPRQANEKEVKNLKESLTRFGFVEPIVVNKAESRKDIIVGGHFRVRMARELGINEVPVVYVDIPEIEREQELNLRLNKNLGQWNYDMLANFDEEMLKMVGWESEELDAIFKGEVIEDDFEVELEEPVSKLGEIYQLGDHRLMCGDSTKREDVEKLMDGKKADMVFTDPPYNVGYDYRGIYKKGKRANVSEVRFSDNKKPEEYQKFVERFMRNAFDSSKDGCPFYVWHASKCQNLVRSGLESSGWYISQTIVWLKNRMVFSPGQDYHRVYEPCYFGWKKKKKHFVNRKGTGDYKEFLLLDRSDFEEWLNVLYEKRDEAIDYQHPTQKPVRLSERAIRKHSPRDGVVLDLFGGSGSTLIACEQLNRKCYMMELDPKYCDVIIKRWETLTNKKAKKL